MFAAIVAEGGLGASTDQEAVADDTFNFRIRATSNSDDCVRDVVLEWVSLKVFWDAARVAS